MASYRRFKPRPLRPIEDPRPLPLPGTVVDAVLRCHDEERAALGELAPRAARVSILWNETESQIIRVLEAA